MNIGMHVNAPIYSRANKKQGGAALLILMLILALTISTVLVTSAGRKDNTVKRDQVSSEVLAKAKDALVGYAYRNEGALPCPDSVGDGLGDSCSTTEGWLPWQTLGVKPLRDGDGVCLRYAVSAAYEGVAPASLVDGDFEIQDVDNNTRGAGIVAVVLAPLEALSGQLRGMGSGSRSVCGSTDSSAQTNDASNYLDAISGVNNAASNPTVFIQADKGNTFNDALIWLSTTDITGSILVCGAGHILIDGVCELIQSCDDGYSPNADGECVDSDGCLVTEAPNNGGVCKNIVCDEGYTANNGGQCIADGNGGGNG